LTLETVVLKLYNHAEPLRSFPSFCRTPFLPNTTERKNGLLKSDDLRRTPETAPSNPRGSIEPTLRTTAPETALQNKLAWCWSMSALASVFASCIIDRLVLYRWDFGKFCDFSVKQASI